MDQESRILKLVLGTAQFGNKYGVANRTGKIDKGEALRVLDLARRNGVDTLDTAVVYGDAESRLGELGVKDFKIVTKVPALPSEVGDPHTWLEAMVKESLMRLRIPQLHGLLLHHAPDLAGGASERLIQALCSMRDSGLVEHIGASIYAPSEAEVIDVSARLTLIQAPMNVLDRRMHESGLLKRLQDAGVEVHLRSAFLQGLLLVHPTELTDMFEKWRPKLKLWHEWCLAKCITPLEACLAHIKWAAPNAKVVIGCDNARQFEEIIKAAHKQAICAPDELCSTDPLLINPSLWGHK